MPQDVSGRSPGLEVVALVEGLAELADLGLFGGAAQREIVGAKGGSWHQSFHDTLTLPKRGPLSSDFKQGQRLPPIQPFRATALQ